MFLTPSSPHLFSVCLSSTLFYSLLPSPLHPSLFSPCLLSTFSPIPHLAYFPPLSTVITAIFLMDADVSFFLRWDVQNGIWCLYNNSMRCISKYSLLYVFVEKYRVYYYTFWTKEQRQRCRCWLWSVPGVLEVTWPPHPGGASGWLIVSHGHH